MRAAVLTIALLLLSTGRAGDMPAIPKQSFRYLGMVGENAELAPLVPVNLFVQLDSGNRAVERGQLFVNCQPMPREIYGTFDKDGAELHPHEIILVCPDRVLVVKGVAFGK